MAFDKWKQRAKELKNEVTALYLVLGDPRISKATKLAILAIVAYALSPIDLIPDFIPVIGYLDDLIIVPLGIALVIRSIPPEILAEYRARARGRVETKLGWIGASVIVALWALGLILLIVYLW